jgi:hypothetical protein
MDGSFVVGKPVVSIARLNAALITEAFAITTSDVCCYPKIKFLGGCRKMNIYTPIGWPRRLSRRSQTNHKWICF